MISSTLATFASSGHMSSDGVFTGLEGREKVCWTEEMSAAAQADGGLFPTLESKCSLTEVENSLFHRKGARLIS